MPATVLANSPCQTPSSTHKFYRPRDHAASPFFKIVREYFDEFERAYPERYQKRFGYWRPVIGTSIEKFLKCGDPKEGFARVRCTDCGKELFVAYSCRQRSCCPSCDQKRTLLLGLRLQKEVLADVPHRQWVFTIPKRLRIFFRYDRSLLGKLCRAAYETVCEIYALEPECDGGIPGMIGAVQTFGSLINWNSHIHAIVSEGVFASNGDFIATPDIWKYRVYDIWQEKVFDILLDARKINEETAACIRSWRYTGFSVHNSVRIDKGDQEGMQRLIEYIARCPFSLARFVSVTDEGKILYKTGKSGCLPFPKTGDENFMSGIRRNFELFEPLDFLAEVTQHIPDKGEHQFRFYGFYSNKKRGMRKGTKAAAIPETPESESLQSKKWKMTWAALIKLVYEADPLKCPDCGGVMKIVAFVEDAVAIQSVLKHCGMWKELPARGPPVKKLPTPESTEPTLDYDFFERECA